MPEPATQDYASVTADLRSYADSLGTALAFWETRSSPEHPDPEARRSAGAAMSIIDAMLAGLHQLRARLQSEIRADDDEFMRLLDVKYGKVEHA